MELSASVARARLTTYRPGMGPNHDDNLTSGFCICWTGRAAFWSVSRRCGRGRGRGRRNALAADETDDRWKMPKIGGRWRSLASTLMPEGSMPIWAGPSGSGLDRQPVPLGPVRLFLGSWGGNDVINTSIHQYINTSIHQYINTSIHQYINTSIHQYINPAILSSTCMPCGYMYIIYTPNLALGIACFVREREQGRFRGSNEGAGEH